MSINELLLRLERIQGRDPYVGQEKRKAARLLYPPNQRPILKIGNCEVEVVDISEGGLKIHNYMRHKFGPNIQGMIVFQSGASYEIDGKVVWQFKNELGLFFERIPLFIIKEEIYYLLRYFQTREAKTYSKSGALFYA